MGTRQPTYSHAPPVRCVGELANVSPASGTFRASMHAGLCGCVVLGMLLAACSREQEGRTATAPAPLKEAKGRVTVLDSTNKPEVADLGQPTVMELPALVPADNNGAQGSATGKPLIRVHTTDDGLPVDAFWCGTLDRNGMLWFGSNGGGLVRYAPVMPACTEQK